MTPCKIAIALLTATLSITLATPVAVAQPVKDPGEIRIGIAKAFFHDLSPVVVDIAVEPFSMLMKDITGLNGKLLYKDEGVDVARKLDNNEIQVAVLHGHEFAWVQKKYPKLVPIILTQNQHRDVRAFVVVNKNNPAKSLADLRGKTIDLPETTKEHCRLFLNKQCSDNATPNAAAFFKSMTKSRSSIASLDNVCRGKLDAVLIDTITLEFYKKEKGPFFEKNLRILQESAAFPPPVIVVKEGALDSLTLKKFREGLAVADKNPAAQDFLKMWQIAWFEPVPATYAKSLADVAKEYPPPAPLAVGMR